MSERPVYQYQYEQIPVSLGSAFSVLPDFSRVETVFAEYTEMVLINSFRLNVGSLGEAYLFLHGDGGILDTYEHVPLLTPAGPVRITHIIDNGKRRPVFTDVPVNLTIEFKDLTQEKAEGLFVGFIYGDKLYYGEPDITNNGNKDNIDIIYTIWRRIDYEEAGEVIFPQDPSVISEIEIIIDHKGLTVDLFKQFVDSSRLLD